MTTTDFWQTLDSLSLDDNTMEHEESKRIIEEISKDLEELIPNKLFRYRSFDSNDYNIRAIERDEIWASSLSIMNDYLEYDPYWDLDLVLTMIEDSVEAIKSLDVDSFVRKNQQGVKDTFGPDIDLRLLKNDDIRNAIVRINNNVHNLRQRASDK